MESAKQGGIRLPQLKLDELLDELRAHVDAARATRDRMHGLFEAVLSVGRELELEEVLRRIVEAAVVLVDARYGALGVLDRDRRRIVQFLTVGLQDEQIATIGSYPSGHGILGEVIRDPGPLILDEISAHQSSYGFPPNHPPMHTFLGVPIRVRDQVFGNLYLTEKRSGARFDADDEAVLSTLAVAAGVAIDNAHLYEGVRRRERWMAASAEVTSSLLSGSPRIEVVGVIADRAKVITGSELAVVAMPMTETGTLAVELTVGGDAPVHRGLVVPADGGIVGDAFSRAAPVTVSDLTRDPLISAAPRGDVDLGPAVAVPIGTAGGVRGVLLLARGAGRPEFGPEDAGPLLDFAGQAAVAMELAERRSEAEQIALLEDRDRIARDLHDLAIQRLFATGMTLQSAERFIQHPEASERVRRAVDDLDDTIKIIRSTIFGLRSPTTDAGQGLRARVVRAVGESREVLGFAPTLRMQGLLDTDVPREVADQLLAVLGEALTNAARHAKAGQVDVTVEARGGSVTLTVVDDGVGIPADSRRSGLDNAAKRAWALGGTMETSRPPAGGTAVVWCAPLPRDG